MTPLLARLRRFVVALACLVPALAGAQDDYRPFSKEQIDQLTAQVALFPDALLSQVLMAATYPLEVVQAHRWLEANKDLSGEKLEAAMKEHDWDASVKSICSFGDIVKRMNDNLDWTQDMGDAFLAQEKDVLDAEQRMRAKAKAEGNLESTEQQAVKVEQEIIIIEQSNPEPGRQPVSRDHPVRQGARRGPHRDGHPRPRPDCAHAAWQRGREGRAQVALPRAAPSAKRSTSS